MPPKKLLSGRWHVDLRPNGRNGKRYRKSFATQAEALAYERYIIAEHKDDDPWQPKTIDHRRLSELSEAWYQFHGNTLTSGKKRLEQLLAICRDLNDPKGRELKATQFIDYRTKRLDSGITANHMNHELTYVKAVFNELERAGAWHHGNPLGKVKKLKLQQKPPHFLAQDEIWRLLAELKKSRNPDVYTIALTCLSTGCRWGEIQYLEGEQVHAGKIHLDKTKNDNPRSIPISEEIEKQIFTKRSRKGALFSNAWEAFELGAKRARIDLPKGQQTHVLRHSFASHFMMNGGNLLTLNKILGHKTIQMTMVYAHLSPDHLSEAINLNPIERGHNVVISES